MKRRIYVDTSVIGGCLDDEFRVPSVRLFQRFETGMDTVVISDLTLQELERAPAAVRGLLVSVPDEHGESVGFTAEAAELAEHYIAADVIGSASRADAQHIATATVHRVDVLVSWNFKHIVNLQRIRGYNAINLLHGYPLLEIRTPEEVLSYEA